MEIKVHVSEAISKMITSQDINDAENFASTKQLYLALDEIEDIQLIGWAVSYAPNTGTKVETCGVTGDVCQCDTLIYRRD